MGRGYSARCCSGLQPIRRIAILCECDFHGDENLPDISGGATTFAPNLATECTPIENWLELEAGVSPFYTWKSTEWDTDFLFKKPWDPSKKAEFMLGVGPQWAHLKRNGKTTDSFSGELAGDFMFWPTGRHRFGWYLEPAYDYSFAGDHQQSIGMSAGLLIGIR